MSIVLEIDRKWGGVYIYKSETSKRLVVGFVAVTYHPFSIYERVQND